MRNRIIGLIIVLLVLSTNSVMAEEEITELSLAEAIKLTMAENSSLQQARRSYQEAEEDLKIYRFMVGREFGLNISSNYNLWDNPSDNTTITVSKNFSERITLSLSQAILEKNAIDEFELEGADGSLRLDYYLIKDYSKGDYHSGLIQQEISLLEKSKALKDAEDAVKNQVINDYYNLIKLQEQLKIKEEMIEQSKITVEVAKARYNTGKALELDREEAELQLAEAKLALEETVSRYRLALARFARGLGVDLVDRVELSNTLEFKEFNQKAAEVEELVYNNDLELKLLEKNIELTEYELKKIRRDHNFNLRLSGGRKWVKGDKASKDYKVGIAMEYNFSTYTSKQKEQQIDIRRSRLEKLHSDLEDQEDELRLEVEDALLKLKRAEKRVGFVQEKIEHTAKRLKIARLRYRSGLISISKVLEKQVDLMDTKILQSNSLATYNLQFNKLMQMIKQL